MLTSSLILRRNVLLKQQLQIEANTSIEIGAVNELTDIPSGYTIAAITLYSTSSGNCIPFLRYSGGALLIYARNVATMSITTDIYSRILYLKNI